MEYLECLEFCLEEGLPFAICYLKCKGLLP